jgi:hypothetical protein
MKCSIEDCDNPREGNTEHCASHNFEKRKAEREAKKVKVVKPVKKVSERRADELKEYPSKKRKFLNENPNCQLKQIGCTGKATEIHHCSISANNFLNEKTWKGGCSNCHHFVEVYMSAEERRILGLLTD